MSNLRVLVFVCLLIASVSVNGDALRSQSKSTLKFVEAIDDQDWSKAKLLLSRGADANSLVNGSPVIISAALCDKENMVVQLLDNGAKINARGVGGETALMVAAAKAHSSIVRILIRRGAKVNLRSDNGATALYLCYEKNPFLSGAKQHDQSIIKTLRLLKRAGARLPN